LPTKTYSPKSKITVTLSAELVRELDILTGASIALSRSELVEEAVQTWLQAHAQKVLEEQTEAYYRSLTDAELKEDQEWANISVQSAKHLWDK